MTLITSPSSNDSPDLAILNLSRLFARLEHNLLSPAADLKPLRRSEYQRMRVGANVEYARTTLLTLERSLPTIKALDRRHDLQTDLTRKRHTLKLLQDILDGLASEAEVRNNAKEGAELELDDDDGDDDDDDEEDLLDGEEDLIVTPEGDSTSEPMDEYVNEESVDREVDGDGDGDVASASPPDQQVQHQQTPAHTPTTSTSKIAPITTQEASSSSIRNRRHATQASQSSIATATATGTSHHAPEPKSTDQTLSTHRLEQEDLTTSLLTLASQLKSSSQSFQATLDSEKSVLSRAVDGIDRTTGNMEAAGKRMGMLRRMTEGKGWWGRMMLYAWIFGLWIVAVLIVFLGPKLRF